MTIPLIVIVPSRGRPGNVARLIRALESTAPDVGLLVAVDDDDPELENYLALPAEVRVGPRLRMNGTLNAAAAAVLAGDPVPDVIGFLGDDHLPETPGWDEEVTRALSTGPGIVYGDDGIQGPLLPTAVFISTPIVEALGYMAPPVLTHLFLDNYWRDLGQAAGCLRYLPHVKITHMHPLVGKGEPDALYAEVNGGPMWEADSQAYEAFVAGGGLARDVATVGALR